MAKRLIDVGVVTNSGSGDPVRTAFQKINGMFDEIYNAFGDGVNLNGYVSTDGTGNTYRVGVWKTVNQIGGDGKFQYDYDNDVLLLEASDFQIQRTGSKEPAIKFLGPNANILAQIDVDDDDMLAVQGPYTEVSNSFSTTRSRIEITPDGQIAMTKVLVDDTPFKAVMDYETATDLPSNDSIVTLGRFGTALGPATFAAVADILQEGDNVTFDIDALNSEITINSSASWDGGTVHLGVALEDDTMVRIDYLTSGVDAGLFFGESTLNVDRAPGYKLTDAGTNLTMVGPTDGVADDPSEIVIRNDGEIRLRQGSGSSIFQAVANYTTTSDLPTNDSIVTKGRINAAVGGITSLTNVEFHGCWETVSAINFTALMAADAADGTVRTFTATSNFTVNGFVNPIPGQTLSFVITQDGTGSRILTPGANLKFAEGDYVLSTDPGTIDILTMFCVNSSLYLCSLVKGFV